MVQNDEHTITSTLQSIVSLGPILVADISSSDKTISICRQFKAEIFRLPKKNCMNILCDKSKTNWNLFLHPWEVLACGHKEIAEVHDGSSCYIQIFQNSVNGDTISKEIRLWNKRYDIKFHNPVFETILDDKAIFLENSCIYAQLHELNYDKLLLEIEDWKKSQPTACEPYYYKACLLLNQGKYSEFLSTVELYLFRKMEGMATITLKYYAALIYLYFGDLNKSIYHITGCLVVCPLMAEYWCLLADIFYKANDFNKAYAFYQNAIILGRKRPSIDKWPVEIVKYKDYPEKMMESCKNMIKSSKSYELVNI